MRSLAKFTISEDFNTDLKFASIWFVRQVYEYQDGSKSLKLGDFGLATVVNGPLHTVCGTPTYVAPEIIAETGWGTKKHFFFFTLLSYSWCIPNVCSLVPDASLSQIWPQGWHLGRWCHHVHSALWLSSIPWVCTRVGSEPIKHSTLTPPLSKNPVLIYPAAAAAAAMTRKLSSSRFCRACLISQHLTGTMCLTVPRLVLGSLTFVHGLWCLGKNMITADMSCFSRLWSLRCCRWRWIRGTQPRRCSIIRGSM